MTIDTILTDYKSIDSFEYDFQSYSHPTSAVISLTDSCNLKCPYCFVKQKDKKSSFDIVDQAIKWLLENCKINNYATKPFITLFGGEPLLCFDEIIVPIVEKYFNDCMFSITTNGVLLNEDTIDFLYKYHVEPLLSFDGVPQVQNKQRPGQNFNSFNIIRNNIPYLLLRFPNTIMRSTVTTKSIPFLYDTVIMAEDFGFKQITLCENAYETWNLKDKISYEEQMTKIGYHIYKTFFTENYPIKVTNLIQVNKYIECSLRKDLKFDNKVFRCGLGTTSCGITTDGKIVPCQEKNSCPSIVLGDVYNGINPDIHQQFLENYFDKISQLTCADGNCSMKECLFCLSSICPSRLEDLDYQISNATCTFKNINTKVGSRLYLLCNNSINDKIASYFIKEDE